jgi:hypothetical protein
MPAMLRARGAGIARAAAAATIVVAEEAFVEDFFFVAPAFGASLMGTLVLGVVLARLAQGSALRSGEDTLALGALAAAVAGTRALAILLELGLELLLGDMLLDKLLDREVYFVEEDDIGLRDKVGELGATPVDLDATEADILLDITSRAQASVADQLIDT